MSVFDADRKAGCSVGCSVVVTDESGQSISTGHEEWHGFERALANQMAMDIYDAVKGIIEGYREAAGDHARIKELQGSLGKSK